MTSSSKSFELAQLAEASYANFINKVDISSGFLLGDDKKPLLSIT